MMTGRLRDLACDALNLSCFNGIETAENFNHTRRRFACTAVATLSRDVFGCRVRSSARLAQWTRPLGPLRILAWPILRSRAQPPSRCSATTSRLMCIRTPVRMASPRPQRAPVPTSGGVCAQVASLCSVLPTCLTVPSWGVTRRTC